MARAHDEVKCIKEYNKKTLFNTNSSITTLQKHSILNLHETFQNSQSSF